MSLFERVYDDFVWGMKFRPKTLDEMILPPHLVTKFAKILDSKVINNLLLHGEAGLGKTTIAYIIADTLDRDPLYINATDEGGINMVRGKLDDYCSKVGWDDGVKRLVILDEFDGMSDKGEKALKVFIETFGKFCDFIFITNHVMEISDKLKSRLQDVSFETTLEEQKKMMVQLAKRLVEICKSENVKYDNKGITELIKAHFPDIRKVMNEAQNFKDYGGILESIVKRQSSFDVTPFMDMMKKKNYQEIQKIVVNLTMSPSRFFAKIFKDGVNRIDPNARGEFILNISEYLDKAERSSQPQIHICAFAVTIMSSIKIN